MKAWIVRWEWMGEHASHDNPLIAVLSARCGVDDIKKFIERHYLVATATVGEQIEYASYRNPRKPAYPAEVSAGGVIHCGHSPFIVGRRGEDVHLAEDGHLVWKEGGQQRMLPANTRGGNLAEPSRMVRKAVRSAEGELRDCAMRTASRDYVAGVYERFHGTPPRGDNIVQFNAAFPRRTTLRRPSIFLERRLVRLGRRTLCPGQGRNLTVSNRHHADKKKCPECGHVFQGNGWDGIDAHWRSKHEHIMPYKQAWLLIREGKRPSQSPANSS